MKNVIEVVKEVVINLFREIGKVIFELGFLGL